MSVAAKKETISVAAKKDAINVAARRDSISGTVKKDSSDSAMDKAPLDDCYLDLGDTGRTLEFRTPPGFSLYPEQVVNEIMQSCYYFNILCVGEIGVGKSSFINTLLEKDVFKIGNPPLKSESISLNTTNLLLTEEGVKVSVTVTETVEYGDHTEKVDLEGVLVNYVQAQYRKYVTDNTMLFRSEKVRDSRIHLCLFFISPTYQALRSLDIMCLKGLSSIVNLVPIISKADILSKEELLKFKSHVIQEFEKNNIEVYKFPTSDKFSMKKNEESNKRMPFAIINANDVEVRDNKKVRVRKYPWGSVAIDDDKNTDFCAVRDLIKLNMCDLVMTTEKKHYEKFRADYINYHGFDPVDAVNPSAVKASAEFTQPGYVAKNYEKLMSDLNEEHKKNKKELHDKYLNLNSVLDQRLKDLSVQCAAAECAVNKKDKHKQKK